MRDMALVAELNEALKLMKRVGTHTDTMSDAEAAKVDRAIRRGIATGDYVVRERFCAAIIRECSKQFYSWYCDLAEEFAEQCADRDTPDVQREWMAA